MSMLKRLPKYVPPLDDVLYDLFRPKPAELADAMGVTEKTARKWIAQNKAPKSVMLALFWLTRWGMQWTDADLYNEAQLHFAMNRCQAMRLRELKARLRKVAKIGDFGAANDPAEGIELPMPVKEQALKFYKRSEHPKASGRGGDLVLPDGPGFIRRRVCQPPTSYQHHVQKKRRTA